MVRVRYSFGSRHTGHIENIRKQRVKYPKVMEEVIDISDIILQVLDSRFIEEMRNTVVEEDLKEKNKKTIFVLNKEDLISNKQKKKLEETICKKIKPYVFVSTKTSKGAKALRDKIKIEAKRVNLEGERKRVQIGVIGYPNAGKSSIINLITRRGVAGISKHAGQTKGMQKIKMAENILILDTPGVIPASEYSTKDTKKTSRDAKLNARTYSNIREPENAVHYLMSPPEPKNPEEPTKEEEKIIREVKTQAKTIEKYYNIEAKGNSEVLIEELGKKKNYLTKGSKVDIDRTARQILRDWQEGKIKIK